MIRFNLDKLLSDKSWSDYKLAKESGIGADVIGKYRRNEVRRPDLDTLNTICETLACSIADLMEYRPDKRAAKKRQPRGGVA